MAISVTDEDHHEQLPFMCIIFHQQYRIRHNLPAFRTIVKNKKKNVKPKNNLKGINYLFPRAVYCALVNDVKCTQESYL